METEVETLVETEPETEAEPVAEIEAEPETEGDGERVWVNEIETVAAAVWPYTPTAKRVKATRIKRTLSIFEPEFNLFIYLMLREA